MKILQINAWGGRLGPQIAQLFKEQAPDVICLQEAISAPNGTGALFYTVEEMKKTFGMHLVVAPTMSFGFMHASAEFGNAILSKYPFESVTTIFTEGSYIEDFDPTVHDYNIRNMLHVTLQGKERPLHILTHHGYHIPSHKNGDKKTYEQCRIVADYVAKLAGDVVLTGDFNLLPHSESLELINDVLDNACVINDVSTTRTSLTSKTEVCDYIFTSRNIEVSNFNVLDKMVSDHTALSIEIS